MEEQEEVIELTTKQLRFIEEYMVDFNATAAAKRAGYSSNTARAIGHENLTKPNIKSEIELRIKSLQLGAEETKKLFSDISKGNANKYLKIVKKEFTPKIKKPLQELIDEIRYEMDFEDEYAIQADLKKKELEAHEDSQKRRRRSIIRYKLELKRNPDAFRVVDGETVLIDSTEFDLVALANDKEAGRIKSYKMTKDGPQVELYSADGALANLARIHGLFVDKSIVDNQVTMVKPLIIDWGDNEEDAVNPE
ncbi:MAG: terminase small subunit [Chryseobacterium sp.]|nr:MAG: terminase small subunit [Chryseobacterium sp.]